ncbi:uncharacterized protein LOC135200864 isoform X1 [Macrobrachium nipponense]|uniref:uncharacterized protein LOC135200864 isoform X1 n=1 Tax=Macrobrachium nipponense TaxID=159736 RepID=UPI0030C89637
MTGEYLLRLFFLPGLLSLGVHSEGDGSTNPSLKVDEGCSAKVTVISGKTLVMRYSEEEREEISKNVEQVRLYCKPDDGFEGIQVEVHGRVFFKVTVNFTAEELGISPVSRWYDVTVTFSYRRFLPVWNWYINVSVKDGGEVEKRVKEAATSLLRLTTMFIYSLGPSEWRFSQPDERCYNQSGQNTTSTDESDNQTQSPLILFIVLGVALAIIISITIAVACKSKLTRAAVPPQTDPGAASSRTVSTENPIYGYVRY